MNTVDFLRTGFIAHRGYHDISQGIPENSLPAFQKAIDFKYAIEFDIHILKDNTVIVFHDDDLKRLTGVEGKVKDLTFEELKKLHLQGTKYLIPTLEDVLNLVDGKVPLLIEFKTDYNLKGLEKEAMKLLTNYNGKYAVQSFHPSCVNFFRKNYPKIPRGQLSYDYKKDKITFIGRYVLRNMLFNFITRPDFISYDVRNYNLKKMFKWKNRRTALGWTVKNKEQFEKNKSVFDILICENMQNYS